MKVLLLAGVPPCHQYTGGLILNSLASFLLPEKIAFCAVTDPLLQPEIPSEFEKIPKLILKKPRELSFRLLPGKLGTISSFIYELIQGLYVKYKILPNIVSFAKEQHIDALWVLLEGQTLIRLSRRLSQVLSIPLFTHTCDPFELWLRHNKIDRFTQRRLLKEFDKIILHSTSCATASWAMSELYTNYYGVKNQPVIASLPKELMQTPALSPHAKNEFIIGIAGQIYAQEEWNCFINALNDAKWVINNRRIHLRILSRDFHLCTHTPAYIEYLGWQSQEKTLRLLAECDLLYLPYWFSEEFRRETTYCFPSKLVTYFAAGRPVFCHAPSYASPFKYLAQHNAGYLCDSLDPQVILNTLKNVINDSAVYAKIAKSGSTCFLRDFTTENMRNSFFECLTYHENKKRKSTNILDLQKKSYETARKNKFNILMPKVSIIIPVYNGANFLKEAIESALSQTYHNIEILVVNDGSNDHGATEAIAHSFGNKIRYISKTNGGVASALNIGISKMTGDYFSWLSHDDIYVKEKIELQINTLSKMNHDKVVLYSNYSVFTTDKNKAVLWKMKDIKPKDFRYWITIENSLHGCTLLIPKTAFEECGLFDEDLRTTQDYDLWFRIAEKYLFINLPEPLVKSRRHVNQGSIILKDIALRETNYLLSNFVKKLRVDEIEQAACCSLALAYAQLASSMWYRGFFIAGKTAFRLSMAHGFNSSRKEIILAYCILIKSVLIHYFIKHIKKFIPFYLRPIIKNLLKPTTTFIKSPFRQPQITFQALEKMNLKDKFSSIYENNLFGGKKSHSGEGSDLVQTNIIRNEIPKLIAEFEIDSVLDAPCGDWYWMKETNLYISQYIGADIVEALIQKNQLKYSNEKTFFKCINLISDQLPKVDLILSRDCFVHLSYQDSLKIIENFKASGSKYLLTTTFTAREHNTDLGDGFWRPINLQLPPFNFPSPIRIINEGCTEGNNMFTDKSLGLWRLDDLLFAKKILD